MNQPIIYYKDGQLNKYKTTKSLLRYYFKCRKLGVKASKPSIKLSIYDA